MSEIERDQRDDGALVTAVQSGDVQSFAPLVDRHLDHIHAFISLRLPLPHLVDELTHETFVFAYRHIHEFAAGTAFRAWLRAIASNKIRAELERYLREETNRRAYAEHRLIEIALRQSDLPDSRQVEALEECLGEVPEHLRTALRLKYHDDYSTAEIAQQLNRTLAWVRTTLCRLRQQLKQCMEAKLAQPS